MRKYILMLLFFLTSVLLLFTLNNKDKNEPHFDKLYGENEKWVVIGDTYNTFQFMYKWNSDDLRKDNETGQISMVYGTILGTSVATLKLNSTNYYQFQFPNDFITALPLDSNSRNPYVTVQISYGTTTDSIELRPFSELNAD